MKGRTYQHVELVFRRTVEQAQTVVVAVDGRVSPELAAQMAAELAPTKLRERGWETVSETVPEMA